MANIPYQCRPLRGGVGTHRLPKFKLREARNRLDSLFATDIGKFSSLKAESVYNLSSQIATRTKNSFLYHV